MSADKFLRAAIITPFVFFFFKGQIKVHLVRHCVTKRLIRVKFSRQQKTNLSKTAAHPIFEMFLGLFFFLLEKNGITRMHYHEKQ